MILKHRGAFEFEWRARFGLPLSSLGKSMEWGEAIRLTLLLRADPSSHVAAAIEDWEHPMSREALLLADNFDLLHLANSDPKRGKPKPHGMRPFKTGSDTKRFGNVKGMNPQEVRALLSRAQQGLITGSGEALLLT